MLKLKNNQTQTQQQRARFRSRSLATVKGKEVVRRIQNYVAQNVAARSLPFTAGEMTLDCVSAALCTIAGPDPLSEKAVDVLTQAGLSNEAAAFFKLRYASGARNPEGPSPKQCKTRKRRRLQLRRGAIKKRIKVLGEDAQTLKKKFLTSCPYITIVIDEGNNWGKACPLYLAVIACNVHYEWRIMFIGQADCSGKKDGASIHKLVKGIFARSNMSDVYDKIASASTDGASVMRSTRDFAGLDCRGSEGRAFSAHLKNDVKDDIDFWHCLCHQLNLSVNDALDAIAALKLFWVPHVSMVFAFACALISYIYYTNILLHRNS